MSIQLQPQMADLAQWILLAQQEGAVFEVMDPFSVGAIGDEEKQKRIVSHYRKTGLARSVHGAFIDVNPASSDPDFRELSQRRCRESCEIALALGADHVVFHSSAFPFLRGAYLRHWAAGCAAFVDELAAQYPVRIYLENAQDLDPAPLRMLMEKLHSDRVGICLDVGHVNYSRAPLERWFEELGQWIGYLHLSDNFGEFDDHCPLGGGCVDWALAHRCWEALGRNLPITLETGDLESTRQSLRFLRRNGYFGLKGNTYE